MDLQFEQFKDLEQENYILCYRLELLEGKSCSNGKINGIPRVKGFSDPVGNLAVDIAELKRNIKANLQRIKQEHSKLLELILGSEDIRLNYIDFIDKMALIDLVLEINLDSNTIARRLEKLLNP